jgi:8-oxo-dGTP diphosphatase
MTGRRRERKKVVGARAGVTPKLTRVSPALPDAHRQPRFVRRGENSLELPVGLRSLAPVNAVPALSYKIAVLVFLENEAGEQLLLLRAKPPNLGVWSPIGGKLETAVGESPFECAARETFEETGLRAETTDFHLFAMIAEKAYEGQSHWLMFLFRCRRRLSALPPAISEGRFAFFSRAAIDQLPIPDTDRNALWPIFDRYRDRFVALKADCAPGKPVVVEVEEITPAP